MRIPHVNARLFQSATCFVVALMAACSGESKVPAPRGAPAPRLAAENGPVDLGNLKANIPPPASDSFTPIRRLKIVNIPDAPSALMDAAEREEGISRFCYQEYGAKADPKLIGAVALVVTVEGNAVVGARVGADDWSSKAGRAVNACLVQKAPQAWKLLAGDRVESGRYVVQLRFRPS